MRVLFVCLGNICRSPTAEGVFRGMVEREGLSDRIEIDSAGTGDWHVGRSPDPRAVAVAAERGTQLKGRARQVAVEDGEHFDLIVAMDRQNRADLVALFDGDGSRVRLLREFSRDRDPDVPDPYSGDEDDFAEAIEIIERGCRCLLESAKPALGGDGSSTGEPDRRA